MGIERYPTNRSLRSVELFSADPAITFAEFITYKYDMTYSAQGNVAKYINIILDTRFSEPDLAAGQLVRQWTARQPRKHYRHLDDGYSKLLTGFQPAVPAWVLSNNQPPHLKKCSRLMTRQ